MPRLSKVFFCSVPELDINYNNTVNFKNKDNQLHWFFQKIVHVMEECTYLRKERALTIDRYIDDILNVNYCIFFNGKKYEYFFVVNKEYSTENSTKLYLKLDVFQTYLFDIDFRNTQSLINRQHCNRYDANGQIISYNMLEHEDLEVGELIVKNRTTLYDYTNKGTFIVTSSDRLGMINGGSLSGGGSSGATSNDKFYLNKMVGENGFVLIKSMEAFARKPYNIGDGTNTIGYGTTEKYDKTHYNQLAPECTEQQASEVFAESLYNYSSYVYNAMVEYGVDMNTVKQHEFDAFVSFYYNHGQLKNKQIFIDYCNNVSRETIYNKWLTTVIMPGSQFEEGLRDRRKREADAFLKGEYRFKKIQNLTDGGYVTDNNGKGYVPGQFIISSSNEKQQQVVASARKLIGRPYVWGGNVSPLGSSNGTDCSGLCQWAYNDIGVTISRTTYTQIKEGIEVSESNLELGDLVFCNFSSPGVPEHVYLYSGKKDGKHMCIEAPRTGLNIRERSFDWSSTHRARRIL